MHYFSQGKSVFLVVVALREGLVAVREGLVAKTYLTETKFLTGICKLDEEISWR